MFNSLLFSSLIGVALAAQFVDQSNGLNFLQQSPLLGSGCPADSPPSCQNSSAVSNLCCFESPGGLLLQVQLWNTHPSTGPHDSWTIHGLWPDNCDATFNEKCDPSRDYTNIGQLLADNGAGDTVDFLKEYWVDLHGNDESFWEHEWATHGTCYSTLVPNCFSDYYTGAEAVAFFQTVVSLFQTLPTYKYLADAGIKPSNRETHTLEEFISALRKGSGGLTPALHCEGKTINSIDWYFNLQGSLVDGTFVPIDSPKHSTCPPEGQLHYPPKNSRERD